MATIIRLVILATLAGSLVGCGQKGPLRRPEAGNLAAHSSPPEYRAG